MADTHINEFEQETRNAVATCTRILNFFDILGYSGHVCSHLRGTNNFIVQTFEQSRAEVTPESLIVVNPEGTPLPEYQNARPPDEVFIHTEIFAAREDVQAVLHFHPETAVLFTLVEDQQLMLMKNHAVRWLTGIPTHNEAAKIVTPAMGQRLVDTLANHNALLLRAHGAVIVAESVEALMIDAFHFVENAETMFRAALLGNVTPLTKRELENIEKNLNREAHVKKLFDYYSGMALDAGTIKENWIA